MTQFTAVRQLLGFTAVATMCTLTACGLLTPDAFPTDVPERTASTNPGNASRAEFGSAWPLEVESGEVSCELNRDGDPVLTFTTPDGARYAVNQLAERTLPPLSDIAAGSIGPLRSFAFTTCEAE